MRKRPLTLQDVADRAGVSKMAVSAVLNDSKSTVGVSDATRARILGTLAELQYQPNAMARALRLKRTDIVGVYSAFGFTDTREPFVRSVLHGIMEGVSAQGKDLLVYPALDAARRTSLTERLMSSKVDAAIILPDPFDSVFLGELRRSKIPCVTLGEPIPGLRCVLADNEAGARALARHLLERGHRRVLYRRPSFDNYGEAKRHAAFVDAITAGGGKVTACHAADKLDRITDSEEALLTGSAARAGRITSVACWRDYSAVQALNFCRTRGIGVPGDMAVAGFDGLDYQNMPHDAVLTTVDAHWTAIARRATESLAAEQSGDSSVPENVIVPCDLIIGSTT